MIPREANLHIIQQSCEWNGWGRNNDATETQAIKQAIIAEAQASGIPEEFILAIMMQESKGCVRVQTTRWDADNPGLLQSAGKASCNPALDGSAPITPCPAATIRAMIHDGTAGEGLRTTLKKELDYFVASGVTDDSRWYKTARRYSRCIFRQTKSTLIYSLLPLDAGEVLTNEKNLGMGPTPCYASDVCNRLIQPFDESVCNNAVIGSVTSA